MTELYQKRQFIRIRLPQDACVAKDTADAKQTSHTHTHTHTCNINWCVSCLQDLPSSLRCSHSP